MIHLRYVAYQASDVVMKKETPRLSGRLRAVKWEARIGLWLPFHSLDYFSFPG